jgi:hypothetical protein
LGPKAATNGEALSGYGVTSAIDLFAATPAGDAYIASDFESMGQQAGLSQTLFKTAEPSPETLAWALR